jgi:hypothetical protein
MPSRIFLKDFMEVDFQLDEDSKEQFEKDLVELQEEMSASEYIAINAPRINGQ